MSDIRVTITGYVIFDTGTYVAPNQEITHAQPGHAHAAMVAAGRNILLGDILASPPKRSDGLVFFTTAHSDDPRWIDVLNMVIRDHTRRLNRTRDGRGDDQR